ncbi:centromere protein C isoform X2 [Ambystoma mexicanum]|uniref:centromere protein C isoform X2 n=1 Tax=Ambystoma mexicanum TaxID=8296 RepID=UPI0037E7013C
MILLHVGQQEFAVPQPARPQVVKSLQKNRFDRVMKDVLNSCEGRNGANIITVPVTFQSPISINPRTPEHMNKQECMASRHSAMIATDPIRGRGSETRIQTNCTPESGHGYHIFHKDDMQPGSTGHGAKRNAHIQLQDTEKQISFADDGDEDYDPTKDEAILLDVDDETFHDLQEPKNVSKPTDRLYSWDMSAILDPSVPAVHLHARKSLPQKPFDRVMKSVLNSCEGRNGGNRSTVPVALQSPISIHSRTPDRLNKQECMTSRHSATLATNPPRGRGTVSKLSESRSQTNCRPESGHGYRLFHKDDMQPASPGHGAKRNAHILVQDTERQISFAGDGEKQISFEDDGEEDYDPTKDEAILLDVDDDTCNNMEEPKNVSKPTDQLYSWDMPPILDPSSPTAQVHARKSLHQKPFDRVMKGVLDSCEGRNGASISNVPVTFHSPISINSRTPEHLNKQECMTSRHSAMLATNPTIGRGSVFKLSETGIQSNCRPESGHGHHIFHKDDMQPGSTGHGAKKNAHILVQDTERRISIADDGEEDYDPTKDEAILLDVDDEIFHDLQEPKNVSKPTDRLYSWDMSAVLDPSSPTAQLHARKRLSFKEREAACFCNRTVNSECTIQNTTNQKIQINSAIKIPMPSTMRQSTNLVSETRNENRVSVHSLHASLRVPPSQSSKDNLDETADIEEIDGNVFISHSWENQLNNVKPPANRSATVADGKKKRMQKHLDAAQEPTINLSPPSNRLTIQAKDKVCQTLINVAQEQNQISTAPATDQAMQMLAQTQVTNDIQLSAAVASEGQAINTVSLIENLTTHVRKRGGPRTVKGNELLKKKTSKNEVHSDTQTIKTNKRTLRVGALEKAKLEMQTNGHFRDNEGVQSLAPICTNEKQSTDSRLPVSEKAILPGEHNTLNLKVAFDSPFKKQGEKNEKKCNISNKKKKQLIRPIKTIKVKTNGPTLCAEGTNKLAVANNSKENVNEPLVSLDINLERQTPSDLKCQVKKRKIDQVTESNEGKSSPEKRKKSILKVCKKKFTILDEKSEVHFKDCENSESNNCFAVPQKRMSRVSALRKSLLPAFAQQRLSSFKESLEGFGAAYSKTPVAKKMAQKETDLKKQSQKKSPAESLLQADDSPGITVEGAKTSKNKQSVSCSIVNHSKSNSADDFHVPEVAETLEEAIAPNTNDNAKGSCQKEFFPDVAAVSEDDLHSVKLGKTNPRSSWKEQLLSLPSSEDTQRVGTPKETRKEYVQKQLSKKRTILKDSTLSEKPLSSNPSETFIIPEELKESPSMNATTSPFESGSGPVPSRCVGKISAGERPVPFDLNEPDSDHTDADTYSSDSCLCEPVQKQTEKIVFPSHTPNVRRSKRTRVQPMQYWRGERVNYKARPSGFVVDGIISPDCKISHRANTSRKNHDQGKRKAKEDVVATAPTAVVDPVKCKECFIACVKTQEECKFVSVNGLPAVCRSLNQPRFSMGKMLLEPLQEKGIHFVHLNTMIFYIIAGKVMATLHCSEYHLKTGDYFFVPPGNFYNIKNLLKDARACILFVQLKDK